MFWVITTTTMPPVTVVCTGASTTTTTVSMFHLYWGYLVVTGQQDELPELPPLIQVDITRGFGDLSAVAQQQLQAHTG